MSKKKFLSELEERLNVLEDNEKQDIINEYKDIIEEKVRNGKTVTEAIADFGDIDELTSGILKAYKINPNYSKSEVYEDSFLLGIERGISKIAKKLAHATKPIIDDIKDNKNITVDKIFELLIKFCILLILLMLLKAPFHIFYEIGNYILDIGFTPLGQLFSFIWRIIVWVIYFISCVLLILIFSQNEMRKLNIEPKKNNKKKEKEKINKENSDILEEKINQKKERVKTDSSVLFIIKTIIAIIFLLPLILVNVGLFVSLTIVIYLIIKGIAIYGILLINIGLILIFATIYNTIYTIIFNQKKLVLFPIIIGIVFITIGGLLTFEYTISLKYYDALPNVNNKPKITTYKENIEGDLYVSNIKNNEQLSLGINNELEDNEVLIEVIYYDDYIYPNKDYHISSYDGNSYINIYAYTRSNIRDLVLDVLKNLKNKEVYNYQSLFDIHVKVYANEKTLKYINKD